MATNWMRRTVMVAACASAALLAACGSSTTDSELTPDRFIAFGDAFTDVGQKGSRYTVNDGSVSNWTQQLASRYGKTITPVASGGLSYAAGNARITAKPDVAGDATTLTVTEQIDRFLAGGAFGANDVVFINAGASDLIAGMAAVRAGTTTPADMVAGRDPHVAGQALRSFLGSYRGQVLIAGTGGPRSGRGRRRVPRRRGIPRTPRPGFRSADRRRTGLSHRAGYRCRTSLQQPP